MHFPLSGVTIERKLTVADDLLTLYQFTQSPEQQAITRVVAEIHAVPHRIANNPKPVRPFRRTTREQKLVEEVVGSAAERTAIAAFEAHVMEMTVIDQRAELIAYYQRRGYRLTGERRAFPIDLDPPLEMVVLEKPLD